MYEQEGKKFEDIEKRLNALEKDIKEIKDYIYRENLTDEEHEIRMAKDLSNVRGQVVNVKE